MRHAMLLFDLDGTLLDSHHEICLSLELALQEQGLDLGMARVRELVDGTPLETIWQEVLRVDLAAARPHNEQEYQRFASAYRRFYMRDLGHATSIFPEVYETLLRIETHQPHTPCAVVSNKSAATVTPLLERFGIARFFELALGCGGTNIPAKPAPDLLLAAAQQLGHAPAACAMVGDTVFDVEAGKRAGMTTFAVSHGMGTRGQLIEAGADFVLADFRSLCDVLFDS
jgi:phosphoglycolate phosphatase